MHRHERASHSNLIPGEGQISDTEPNASLYLRGQGEKQQQQKKRRRSGMKQRSVSPLGLKTLPYYRFKNVELLVTLVLEPRGVTDLYAS